MWMKAKGTAYIQNVYSTLKILRSEAYSCTGKLLYRMIKSTAFISYFRPPGTGKTSQKNHCTNHKNVLEN